MKNTRLLTVARIAILSASSLLTTAAWSMPLPELRVWFASAEGRAALQETREGRVLFQKLTKRQFGSNLDEDLDHLMFALSHKDSAPLLAEVDARITAISARAESHPLTKIYGNRVVRAIAKQELRQYALATDAPGDIRFPNRPGILRAEQKFLRGEEAKAAEILAHGIEAMKDLEVTLVVVDEAHRTPESLAVLLAQVEEIQTDVRLVIEAIHEQRIGNANMDTMLEFSNQVEQVAGPVRRQLTRSLRYFDQVQEHGALSMKDLTTIERAEQVEKEIEVRWEKLGGDLKRITFQAAPKTSDYSKRN